MTYRVGIEVNDGLVFPADTRASGSFDDVRVHRKVHVVEYPADRVLIALRAGNLTARKDALSLPPAVQPRRFEAHGEGLGAEAQQQ